MTTGAELARNRTRFARAVARHPALVLAAGVLLAGLSLVQLWDLGAGRLRLSVDPSLDPLVAADHPDRQYYEKVRRRFGSDEGLLVLLEAQDPWSAPMLRALDRLSQELQQLPEVAAVRSLTTLALPHPRDGEIAFERLRPDDFGDAALSARARALVAANPLIAGHLVSTDGRGVAVLVSLRARTDREYMASGLTEQVRAAADAQAAPGLQARVTGAPIIREATSEAVVRQLQRLVPAVIGLLALALAVAFRSVRGVLLPLLTIVVALACTLAVFSLLGRTLNLVTSLVPPLLATMGLAYCAHVLSEFESLPAAAEPADRVVALLREITGPVVLTAVTTAAGLLALGLTDLPAIREFAWLSALGVFVTAALALSFLPAALALFARADRPLPARALFEQGSRRLGDFDTRHRAGILLAAGAVFLLAVAASGRIRANDQFIGVFPPDSRVRQDFEAVNRVLGGVTPLSIAIDAPLPNTFVQPQMLAEVDALAQWLRAQPEIGAVMGLPAQVRALDAAVVGEPREGLPPADQTAQLLMLGDRDLVGGVVNGDRSSTLLRLRVRIDDTAAIAALLERLQPRLDALPEGLSARVTGQAALVTASLRSLTWDQLQSIGLALLLVYLCLAAQFASPSIGLLATLPTLLQTAIYFGAMGLGGVALNATTSLVECLVLGLAVDDTIHYLARFNGAAKRTGSESAAARAALSAVLRPVTLTKAMLALGFLVLATGELHNQVVFGLLGAFTLAAAWLVDVFVTPAFMSGVRIVTLWDSLRLDLGADVQGTIPLFRGLSNRQARVFALMSDLQRVPAGQRIITAGETADDIYVVIDGELRVWADRETGPVHLTTLQRGAVLGETGYFGQRRTANVEAVTDARLLRFDGADQERICHRYPEIAARVFLNLNRIQAERTARRAADAA